MKTKVSKTVEAAWRKEKLSKQELIEIGIVEQPREKASPNQKYDPNIHPHQCYTMCAQYGSSIKELAELFNTTTATITNWINDREEFANALRMGRDAFNTGKIEKALVCRALGYEFTEEITKQTSIRKKEGIGDRARTIVIPVTETTIIKKQLAPDVEAIKFFLKNRAAERWKDTQLQFSMTEQIGNMKTTLSGLSKEDILKLRSTVKSVLESQNAVKEIEN